jgi:hypothetical protein
MPWGARQMKVPNALGPSGHAYAAHDIAISRVDLEKGVVLPAGDIDVEAIAGGLDAFGIGIDIQHDDFLVPYGDRAAIRVGGKSFAIGERHHIGQREASQLLASSSSFSALRPSR